MLYLPSPGLFINPHFMPVGKPERVEKYSTSHFLIVGKSNNTQPLHYTDFSTLPEKKNLQTNLPLHVLVIQICWFLWWSSPALSVWFLLSYTSHPEMNKNTQKWKIFRLLFCYKIFFNLSLVVWKVVSANLGLKVKLALDFSRNRVYLRAYILKVLP